MIKAIKLEWLKLRYYRTFWILLAMYFLALAIICFGGMFLLEYLKSKGADLQGIDPTILPIYDFPDIWQNMTYLSSFLRIILAFIVIISVTNDLAYNTLRQNIIDGMSKKEYFLSKFLLIIGLGFVSTLFVFLAGLINGSMYSHVWGIDYIVQGSSFLLAYWYDTIVFCSLAFVVSLIIKRVGFVIVLMFLYSIIFEPTLVIILENAPFLRDSIAQNLAVILPINAINNLIEVPFPRYIFREIQDYVSWSSLLIATGWIAIYVLGILFLLNKRDLK